MIQFPVSSPRTLKVLLTLVSASVALGALPAQAQEPAPQSEIDLLRQQLAAMQARLDSLEAAQKAAATSAATAVKAAAPTVASASKLPVTISGLLQVQGNAFFNQDTSAARAQSDSFRLRRGELRVIGNITPRLTGNIMFDLAKASAQQSTFTPAPGGGGGGTVATTNNQANNPLQEIVLAYQLRTAPRSPLFFDAGQFKVPIGFEGDLVSSGALQTIDRALFYRETDNVSPLNITNAGNGGGFGDRREKGVRLRGSFGPQFDYQLAAFSGLGERQNTVNDTGDQKIPVARVVFKPTRLQGLQIGLSGSTGSNRFGGTQIDRRIVNGFVVYARDKFTFQTEYLKGKGTVNVTPETFKDVRGYYASLGYKFTPRIEGVLRYDTLKRDFQTAATGNETTETILGLNYYLKGNNAKLQLNLVKSDNDFNTPTAQTGDNLALRTQLQVAF